MDKKYTKADLFDKSMTLKKLQEICTKEGIVFETDNNKATLANLILRVQKDRELTSPGECVGDMQAATSDAAPGVDDQTVAEIAAQNGEASKAADDAAFGQPHKGHVDDLAERSVPPIRLGMGSNPVDVPGNFKELVEYLNAALGIDELKARMSAVESLRNERLQAVEKIVDGLVAAKRSADTTHGSIDNLPTLDELPTIDNLPKIG